MTFTKMSHIEGTSLKKIFAGVSKRIKIRIMLLTPLLLALFFSFIPANSTQDTPSYYPSGPQKNVNKSVVESGGWTLCWSGTYGGTDLLSNITTACDSDYIMYAGGLTGNSNLMLLAAGEKEIVFTIQPGMSNQTILNNGTYWYYNPTDSGSMGFAPNSTIRQYSADVYAAPDHDGGLDDGTLRLSWHTGDCGSGKICGGWRVGTETGLNESTQYTRYIYESTGGLSGNAEASPWVGAQSITCPAPNPWVEEQLGFAPNVNPVLFSAENTVGKNITQSSTDSLKSSGVVFDTVSTKVSTATETLPVYGCKDKLLSGKVNQPIQFIAGGYTLQSDAHGYINTSDLKWHDTNGVTLYTNTAAFMHTIKFTKTGKYVVVLTEQPDTSRGLIPTYGVRSIRFVINIK